MGFHHLAIATRDLKGTHAFYTNVMGFSLVKVAVGETPTGGWAKHLFYETGGDGLIAFWDIHDAKIPADFDPRISEGLGLPDWANHIAFHAADVREIEAIRERWLAKSHDVAQIDHGWCTSIYTKDPNGILVEFCTTTQPFTDADRAEALRLLEDPQPALLEAPKSIRFFRAPAA
jgi:catechol 2,3-dioxygenase-like lactoylglutathione lyase family enzyme